MIEYYSETDFQLVSEHQYTDWIKRTVTLEGGKIEKLSYVFCSDDYLLELNRKFLKHDTLTDILTFPLSEEGPLNAEIYISIPRIEENAKEMGMPFEEELKRVMIHGVLHLFGHDDETREQKEAMRQTEDNYLKLFHVEQQGNV